MKGGAEGTLNAGPGQSPVWIVPRSRDRYGADPTTSSIPGETRSSPAAMDVMMYRNLNRPLSETTKTW